MENYLTPQELEKLVTYITELYGFVQSILLKVIIHMNLFKVDYYTISYM